VHACRALPPAAALALHSILTRHNGYRQYHQVGPLAWDTTVAASAMTYAQKCIWAHEGSTNPYGENLYATTASDPAAALVAAITGWYNEVSAYSFSNPSFSGRTGHFTQVGVSAAAHSMVRAAVGVVWQGLALHAHAVCCAWHGRAVVCGGIGACDLAVWQLQHRDMALSDRRRLMSTTPTHSFTHAHTLIHARAGGVEGQHPPGLCGVLLLEGPVRPLLVQRHIRRLPLQPARQLPGPVWAERVPRLWHLPHLQPAPGHSPPLTPTTT
jgi:hypothetical protein